MQISGKLLKACLDGDHLAHMKLYEDCFPFLMSICIRYTSSRDEALEFLNTGFYKILITLEKYQGKGSFPAWIKRIMINSIIDEMRRQKKYKNHISLLDNTELQWKIESDQDWFNASSVTAEDIYRFIAELPPLTANVFNLFAIDGYMHKEIAKKLGIGLSASKWHYATAKKKLQDQILALMKSKKMSLL